MVLITSELDWNNQSSTATENIILGNNIIFTSLPKQINLGTYTFEGNNKTITLPSSSDMEGLFQLSGGTIKNLTVDGSNSSLSTYNAWIVKGETTTDIQYGNIINCHVYGTISNYAGGGIVGNYFGNSTSLIQKCSAHPAIGETNIITNNRCGGIAGFNYNGGIIEHCYCTGNIASGNNPYSGGIVGGNMMNGIVRYCYMSGDINPNAYAGGIVGRITNGSVENCYCTGNITNSSNGGIIGRYDLIDAVTDQTVSNCYHTGTLSTNSGGIIGTIDNFRGTDITLYLNNCYVATGTNCSLINNISQVDTNNTLIYSNCYINGGSFIKSISEWTTINSDSSNSLTGITNAIDASWDTNVWEAGETDALPLLKVFDNISAIDGSTITPAIWTGYSVNTDEPTFVSTLINYLDSKPIGDYLMLLDSNDIYNPITQMKLNRYNQHFKICKDKLSQGKSGFGPYKVTWNCLYNGGFIYPTWEIGTSPIEGRNGFDKQLKNAMLYSRENVIRSYFNNFR